MPAPSDLLTLGGALLAGGVAFGGVATLVRRTDLKLETHIASDDKHARDVIDRLERIETMLKERH